MQVQNLIFLFENNLNSDRLPHNWFEAFLPPRITGQWTTFTNMKALLDNAGNEGEIYPYFTPFLPAELRQYIALYMIHGLNPLPSLEKKFQSQAQDDISRNDFIKRNLGPGAQRRLKHFKRFFAVQDPRLAVPPTSSQPNFKIDPFLSWIKLVRMEAWRLGKIVSVDKQTIGFQGRHVNKLRITYKCEGDGFQCDALCDAGYTFNFYFRHKIPPKNT